MLSTHGRYDFSPIDQRPDYAWPGGKRLAVYLALNVEQFGWDKSVESAIAPAGMHNKQSVFSWRDYGNRVGFWRLMDLFEKGLAWTGLDFIQKEVGLDWTRLYSRGG